MQQERGAVISIKSTHRVLSTDTSRHDVDTGVCSGKLHADKSRLPAASDPHALAQTLYQ